jgi:dTDP-4-dehydrorhamnose reductase
MKRKPTFHIFGATGLIGSALIKECENKHYDVCLYSRSGLTSFRFDLVNDDYNLLASKIKQTDYIVNLAAMSQPMLVHKNKEYSNMINVIGNQKLHDIAVEVGCKYFFMSSVEVFDGTSSSLKEEAPKNPVNEYGRQKASAEDYILNHVYDNYVIARTSWNVSSTKVGRCLVPFMIKSLKIDNARMATDNIFTIASAKETANVIIQSVESDFRGIVHIASPDPISRYEIAEIIIQSYSAGGLACKPCLFRDLKFNEPRSRMNILNVTKSIIELQAVYSHPSNIIESRVREINELEERGIEYV